ncbi:MAG: NAD(P)/FAD-dependent oxidoreductase [Lachnospiraceae bacterium]|nr:NAD(P)/FAD-dependent oxidoreductase [Lachnospiraceae bacterium]
MGKEIIIIGAGAAGLMAAAAAGETLNAGRAAGAAHITVLEKNEKAGKKIYITGKGRCNFTNACDTEDFFGNVVSHAKFLYSAIYGFTSQDAMDFFEGNGLVIKTERGNRVFPASDHASDVTRTLVNVCKKRGVDIRCNTEVVEILREESASDEKEIKSRIIGVKVRSVEGKGKTEELHADAVIIATGGLSYQSTGSTGDGYRFAREMSHRVTDLRPALIPLNAAESFCAEISGLSLKNISIRIMREKKKLYEDFGEMLFTHFGVSGPVILSGSSYVVKELEKGELDLFIDLKPAIPADELEQRLLREFSDNINKNIDNMFGSLVPKKLTEPVLMQAKIPVGRVCRDVTVAERKAIVQALKSFHLTITSARNINEAIITSGGVDVRDINPSTMESKIVKGLFFAGEVIDVDALTGGYNLQIAWSTGHLAGISAAESVI